MVKVDLFDEVREVKYMGFKPFRYAFLYVLLAMSKMSRRDWESKKKLLMSFGWSEQEFLLALRKQPLFMLTSKKKMQELMEFYVTKARLEPSDIDKYTESSSG
ncbi:hypothetical protein JCGZ_10149 [Jatropha curcas]|uniref:Uncharacterized protein n=1 Tax=Jatropha curcas TaxID=180498 RepID=A0A067LP85_JATCU|nr:hypothetical protein JCGZ_10149 [Jatropha curcas]